LSSEPDYGSYTVEELLDVLEHIDSDAYPERVERIKSEIGCRSNTEVENSSLPFKFTKKESYCLTFFVCLGLILFSIFTGEIPISKSGSVFLESSPKLYWLATIIWLSITIYSGFRWITFGKDFDA
jgi:hypothetical protein